jgi:lysophospholipase L1-like esterase
VLLLSDDYHSKFDSERFSRRYDVKKIYYKKIEDARRNDDVLSKIRSHRPEIVFIHIGVNDVMQKNRKPFRVFKENFSSLIKTVLENTNWKICFSQVIPIPGLPTV